MKKNLLYTLLAALTAMALLAAMLVDTFCPAAILPVWNIPNLVVFSLVVLLTQHAIAPTQERNLTVTLLFSTAVFALLPAAAGFVRGTAIIGTALSGGIVFTVVTWLFTSMTARITSGKGGFAAVLVGSLGMVLAAQAFTGIFL